MGSQAGTENSFFEISQENPSVLAALRSHGVKVPSVEDSSPHLFRPPVGTLVGIQLD